MSSEAITGTPWAAIMSSTVDFPVAMEPVSPTFSTSLSYRCLDLLSERPRHLRTDAEPGLEPGHCLVQEHPQSVDDPEPQLLRLREQRGDERGINDVGHQRVLGQEVQLEVLKAGTAHADRGRID